MPFLFILFKFDLQKYVFSTENKGKLEKIMIVNDEL